MNRDAHQLRPDLFGFESSLHNIVGSQSETRQSLSCIGTEVRLTKHTLVGSSDLPYKQRCCTRWKCVSSYVFPVCMFLMCDMFLLPAVALHGAQIHVAGV